jgi:glycosyltransferase involved in cell wall biosynthesis
MLISLGNIASRTSVNQKLYIHWAYFAYGVECKSIAPTLMYFKRLARYFLIRAFSGYADKWIVQTNVMKKRLVTKFHKNEEDVEFIYPGFERLSLIGGAVFNTSNNLSIFYPSIYYSHKNFELLQRFFSDEAISKGVDLTLTLPGRKFQDLGFDKCKNVKNLNVISYGKVMKEYLKHNALVMPTLLETFGLPYLEAMSLGMPILSSDKDFAHEICGDFAFYFDPESITSLGESIERLKETYAQNVDFSFESKKSLSKFPSWKESVEKLFA